MTDHAVTIVVLAGGHATRLPGKLSRPIGSSDVPLLVSVVRRLEQSGRPCVLSLREPLSRDLASLADVRCVIDHYRDAGPLGGLASATAHVQTPLIFAAAGDLANIEASVIDELIQLYEAERINGAHPDGVVPRHRDGRLEPLAALYNTQALHASAVRMLESDRKRVTAALEDMRIIYHDIPLDRAVLYHNVNTVADLRGVLHT